MEFLLFDEEVDAEAVDGVVPGLSIHFKHHALLISDFFLLARRWALEPLLKFIMGIRKSQSSWKGAQYDVLGIENKFWQK